MLAHRYITHHSILLAYFIKGLRFLCVQTQTLQLASLNLCPTLQDLPLQDVPTTTVRYVAERQKILQ